MRDPPNSSGLLHVPSARARPRTRPADSEALEWVISRLHRSGAG